MTLPTLRPHQDQDLNALREHIRHVYALIDPRDGLVRYVGCSANPARRMHGHLSYARKGRDIHTLKGAWIKSLLDASIVPSLRILESTSADWESAERKWIEYYREEAFNVADGGSGSPGFVQSDELKQLRRQQMKGRVFTPEWKAKISAAKKGRTSPAIIAAAANARKQLAIVGRSEESNAKRSAALLGRKRPPDVVERIAAAIREGSRRRKSAQ
jgi:hypothetical protein